MPRRGSFVAIAILVHLAGCGEGASLHSGGGSPWNEKATTEIYTWNAARAEGIARHSHYGLAQAAGAGIDSPEDPLLHPWSVDVLEGDKLIALHEADRDPDARSDWGDAAHFESQLRDARKTCMDRAERSSDRLVVRVWSRAAWSAVRDTLQVATKGQGGFRVLRFSIPVENATLAA